MIVAKPSRRAGFCSRPNIETATNSHPNRIRTKVSVFGNPKFLAWHSQAYKNQFWLHLFEAFTEVFFFICGKITVLRSNRQSVNFLLPSFGRRSRYSWGTSKEK